ncbi:MAG: hypothetical protein AAF721_42410 [Myxococcota bacterium]
MRWLGIFGAALLAACTKTPREDALDGGAEGDGGTAVPGTSDDGATGLGSGGGSGDGTTSADPVADSSGGTTGAQNCECAPGTDLIYVVSEDGELWSFDPEREAFALVGPLACGGFRPYSMAIDRTGRAWLLLLDDVPLALIAKGMFTVDINDPSDCQAVAYTAGLFGVFGMSFVDNPPPATCEQLFVHSYSGQGPFAEGDGIGMLGMLDADDALQVVSSTDFDGAELAGTSEGRLFSLAGNDPVKVIEYDRESGEELSRLDVEGVEKTGASAMAYYGGDFYLFTEAGAPDCDPCMQKRCADELAACDADPECGPIYDCLLASGGDGLPGCMGDIVGPGGPLRDCMVTECPAECSAANVVSRVTHIDHDDSDGGGQGIDTLATLAPIRVVGAASSTCVPVFVP